MSEAPTRRTEPTPRWLIACSVVEWAVFLLLAAREALVSNDVLGAMPFAVLAVLAPVVPYLLGFRLRIRTPAAEAAVSVQIATPAASLDDRVVSRQEPGAEPGAATGSRSP